MQRASSRKVRRLASAARTQRCSAHRQPWCSSRTADDFDDARRSAFLRPLVQRPGDACFRAAIWRVKIICPWIIEGGVGDPDIAMILGPCRFQRQRCGQPFVMRGSSAGVTRSRSPIIRRNMVLKRACSPGVHVRHRGLLTSIIGAGGALPAIARHRFLFARRSFAWRSNFAACPFPLVFHRARPAIHQTGTDDHRASSGVAQRHIEFRNAMAKVDQHSTWIRRYVRCRDVDLESFRRETRTWLEQLPRRCGADGLESDTFWVRNLNSRPSRSASGSTDARQGLDRARIGRRKYGAEASIRAAKIVRSGDGRDRRAAALTSFGFHLGRRCCTTAPSAEEAYLPDIRGKIRWCQGYSEPTRIGSRLMETRAESDGDDLFITARDLISYANYADGSFAWCVPTRQPRSMTASAYPVRHDSKGVTTKRRLISGYSPFCETFFDGVRVPKSMWSAPSTAAGMCEVLLQPSVMISAWAARVGRPLRPSRDIRRTTSSAGRFAAAQPDLDLRDRRGALSGAERAVDLAKAGQSHPRFPRR